MPEPRVTVDDLKLVLSTGLPDTSLEAFIADASLWVDEELATTVPAISAERLALIEKYLACALVRIREAGLTSMSLAGGRLSESYQRNPNVTEYLERAAALDWTGKIRVRFLPAMEATSKSKFIARVGTRFVDDV